MAAPVSSPAGLSVTLEVEVQPRGGRVEGTQPLLSPDYRISPVLCPCFIYSSQCEVSTESSHLGRWELEKKLFAKFARGSHTASRLPLV